MKKKTNKTSHMAQVCCCHPNSMTHQKTFTVVWMNHFFWHWMNIVYTTQNMWSRFKSISLPLMSWNFFYIAPNIRFASLTAYTHMNIYKYFLQLLLPKSMTKRLGSTFTKNKFQRCHRKGNDAKKCKTTKMRNPRFWILCQK